jgi:hypothetical protein
MYATVRRYENAGALADAMSAKRDDVQKLISEVPGFVNYYATREGDAITTVSIYNDKAGCDESTRLAREWVRENVQGHITPPEVSGGDVYINFSK